ncbi:hypothetical protein [Curvibacter sp. PAE-UM]|uniref:WapI family immunity protein n=1 Tax=Curvibacter sp. PAE-UM TaxID=1714344 RepID=UPI00070CB3EF|nr:hypothetical protein [Curvibacter sp. PAE-UM]KRH99694.1 hypothetical protein AO057_17315 [Curvibacter sp. PAE-UM]
MKIATRGLELELVVLRPADEEGWCRVRASVQVPGFDGEIEAWLQTDDLSRFAAELRALDENVGQPGSARLASAEPDIELVISTQRLGAISGRYRLESERREGVPTVLSGAFDADQSFLPGMVDDVKALLSELGGAHEA